MSDEFDPLEEVSSKKKPLTRDQVKVLVDEMLKEAFENFNQKGVRIYRNWSNQHDPKSDLIWVSSLGDIQLRNLMDYLITNEHHFHYIADYGGKHNAVQVSGNAYKQWNAGLQK
jgi:hypothetical protein